jgi:hypothetical protein
MEETFAQPSETPVLSKGAKYHALYREERLAKMKEAYNNKPEVIKKRLERERIKAEREEEKTIKAEERIKLQEEKRVVALASRKKPLKGCVAVSENSPACD